MSAASGTPQDPALAGALPPISQSVPTIHYVEAARRHMADANSLLASSRSANAGQLYGFVAECGLKALLVVCGVTADSDGEIPKGNRFRQHVPVLPDRIVTDGHLIPDSSRSSQYLTSLAHLGKLSDWLIDHRYWRETALPLASVNAWKTAAEEILQTVDKAKQDGILI